MPQQFVQLASGSPDYSNLLNQTQTVAQREHAVAMRKATQAALLQQLADRGQLQGLQDGDVKIGRHGIETSSPEAAERWRQAQAPTTESLSKDIQGYVTQTVVDKSEDLAQKSGAAAVAINAALNPNQAEHEAITMAMARNSYAQSQGMIDDNARDWARDGQVRGPQPSETPQQRREAALGAMGALIGMNRQQQPDTSGGPQPGAGQGYGILRPGNTATAPGTTTPPPAYGEKHKEKDKKGETRSGRDMIKTSLDNTNFKIETTDRIRTESDAGLRFHDDIRESLPSLRKAATIEAISSMFSGAPSPGQFNQLAEQRERDLVEYNKRYDAQGKKVVYSGGNTNITTTGGKSAAEAADARYGSSTTEIHNENTATGNSPGRNTVPKAGIGTFQGVDGAAVEGNWETINGEPHISGLKNKLAVFGLKGTDGPSILGEFQLRAEQLRQSDYNVVIDQKSLGEPGKQNYRSIRYNNEEIGQLIWDKGKGWFINPKRGKKIPARILSELTGNEFNTDDVGRNELGMGTRPRSNQ